MKSEEDPKHVHFSGNKISDDAAKYFAAALLDNSRLGDLNLSHNELSDGTGEVLGNAIGKLGLFH